MSNNYDSVVELFSSAEKLAIKAGRKELQTALKDSGFTVNADRYANPDGVIGKRTSQDIMGFIRENPAAITALNPQLYKKLIQMGHRKELREIVKENPAVKQELLAQANALVGDGSVKDLHKTPQLKEWQTASSLLGEYKGKIDGLAGKRSKAAESELRTQFKAAFGEPVAVEVKAGTKVPINKVQTFTVKPDGSMEPTPVNKAANDTPAVDYHMKMHGWGERGLKKGDGIKEKWSNKKGDQVWSLQVLLNRNGAVMVVDGKYGKDTAAAVKEFQKTHGLPETGQADAQTLKTLLAQESSQPVLEGQANPKMYTAFEQRKIITDIMPAVEERTGVSAGYMNALWGKETKFGLALSSGTGSEGNHQITGKTFRGLINKYGDEIAADLKALGQDDLADRVLASQAGAVDGNLRYDPYVSTFSSAYYNKEIGVDTKNDANWGGAYASYNIGPGGFSVLIKNKDTANVGAKIDAAYPGVKPAGKNPYFFKGKVTGDQALDRYQKSLEDAAGEFSKRVQPKLDAYESMQKAAEEAQTSDLKGNQLSSAPLDQELFTPTPVKTIKIGPLASL